MRREIKFRGWDGLQGVFAYLEILPCRLPAVAETKHLRTAVKQWHQFTGLYDCMGVKIWEGDILELPDGSVGEMVWCRRYGGYYAKIKNDSARNQLSEWWMLKLLEIFTRI
ncbi:MAG: YopX family protein [Rhodosalinus sp.]